MDSLMTLRFLFVRRADTGSSDGFEVMATSSAVSVEALARNGKMIVENSDWLVHQS